MELNEFIRNTLTDIATGIQGAIDESAGKGYWVNPSASVESSTYTVHFDLAVESEKDGKADIKVLHGGISEKSLNRLSFDVNMTFPTSGNIKRPRIPD